MKKTVFVYTSFAFLLTLMAMIGFVFLGGPEVMIVCMPFLNCFLIITCTGIVVGHIKKLIKVLTDPRYRIDRKD